MAAPSFLVMDIETVLDPELPIVESSEAERLPAPPHHRVIVIGALLFGPDYSIQRLGCISEGAPDGLQEARILSDFAKFLDSQRPDLVTWNGRGFDLPVIASRCLRHGIPLRHYYRDRDVRYRFSPAGHLDLMDFIADFGASKPARLDIAARLCGLPGKVGVEGKDVGPMYHAGRLAEIRDYCLCDVAQTAGVFLRLQLVRGELELSDYRRAMTGLIERIRAEPRLAVLLPGLDERRLLVESAG